MKPDPALTRRFGIHTTQRDWQGKPYDSRTCEHCGCAIKAPASRMRQAFMPHVKKCSKATMLEREVYITTGKWPRRRKA